MFLPQSLRINPISSRVWPLILAIGLSSASWAQKPAAPVLLDAMQGELDRAFHALGHAPGNSKQVPPYFMSYAVSDSDAVSIRAQFGSIVDSSARRARVADIQIRLGDPKLDNTHGEHRGAAVNSTQLPLTDDRPAIARALWLATNQGYGTALDNYLRV